MRPTPVFYSVYPTQPDREVALERGPSCLSPHRVFQSTTTWQSRVPPQAPSRQGEAQHDALQLRPDIHPERQETAHLEWVY